MKLRLRHLWMATLVIGAFVTLVMSYDFFANPKGGFSCPTFEDQQQTSLHQRLCVTSGSFAITKLRYAGRENMYLVKFGRPLFRSCLWLDVYRYDVSIDGGITKRAYPEAYAGGNATYSCYEGEELRLEIRTKP